MSFFSYFLSCGSGLDLDCIRRKRASFRSLISRDVYGNESRDVEKKNKTREVSEEMISFMRETRVSSCLGDFFDLGCVSGYIYNVV